MAKIGSLTADLKLESAAFIRDLRKAAQETARNTNAMQASMARLQKGFASVAAGAKSLFGLLVTYKVAQTILGWVDAAKELADEIKKSAAAAGLTTAQFQAFRAAAMNAGLASEQFDGALGRFVNTMGQVRAGQGALYEKLKATNPAFLEQLRAANNTGEALDIFFTGLDKVSGAAERSNLLTLAFGKGTQRLGELAGKTSIELEKMYAALIIPPQALATAETLRDNWDLLKQALQAGFATGFLGNFNDTLKTTSEKLEAARKAGELAGSIIGRAFRAAADGVDYLIDHLADLQQKMSSGEVEKIARGVRNMFQPIIDGLVAVVADLDATGTTKELLDAFDKAKRVSAEAGAKLGTSVKASAAIEIPPSYGAAVADATEQQRKFADSLRLTAEQNLALIEATRLGQDEYNRVKDTFEATNDVLRAGIDVTGAYGQQLIALGVSSRQSARELSTAQEEMQMLPQLAEQFGQAISSSFVDAIIEGKKLNDVLRELVKQLASIALNALFRTVIGAPGTASAAGSGILGAIFHSGLSAGAVGEGRAPRRKVPALAYVNAPRFHAGLFAPGEYPAILKRNERVLTPEQWGAITARGGEARITIVNPPGVPLAATERRGANGEIEIVLEQQMTKIARRQGPFSRALAQSNYVTQRG